MKPTAPETPFVEVFIALGSNLGDRSGYLQIAFEALKAHPSMIEVQGSPIYETKAHTWSETSAPDYLNAVVKAKTNMSPLALLALCHQIESENGRARQTKQGEQTEKWASRTLDLDILVYGTQSIHETGLSVPHPRMADRRFVLKPLLDLAPRLLIPLPFNQTVAHLWAVCTDPFFPQKTDFNLDG